MCHGNNPTALQSQKMIINAMLELMEKKDFAKINIKELCEKAMISRQTFYTLFDNKEEVIELHLDTLFMVFVKKYMQQKNEYILKELCNNTVAYLIENKDLIQLMVKSNLDYLVKNRMEIYLSYLDCLLHTPRQEDREYMIAFLSGGLMNIITLAVKNNDFEDGQKISSFLEKIFTQKMPAQ